MFHSPSSMRSLRVHTFIQVPLLAAVTLGILWRGGKSLDATLVLSLLAALITLLSLIDRWRDSGA
ncbi:MAG: hypothetical protein PHZ00_03275, partial [Candidatus Peribacteraceae bacterium]|nr:hypothetical protein [Candidatus Peribacteraceae bacterium]